MVCCLNVVLQETYRLWHMLLYAVLDGFVSSCAHWPLHGYTESQLSALGLPRTRSGMSVRLPTQVLVVETAQHTLLLIWQLSVLLSCHYICLYTSAAAVQCLQSARLLACPPAGPLTLL